MSDVTVMKSKLFGIISYLDEMYAILSRMVLPTRKREYEIFFLYLDEMNDYLNGLA